jgi:cytochrome c biogenesis protein CcmG/thiol:disulfide interchange protein DsbE
MNDSGFTQTSEAERQMLPPEGSRWPVWPWLLLMLGLAVVLVLRSLMTPAAEARGEHHPAVGVKLGTLRLEPLTGAGQPVAEADLQGKVTLINFWGPWCGACAVEFPHLVELEQHFRGQPGFQFFSLSSNYDPRDEKDLAENTELFLKHHKAEFPTYRDPDARTTVGLMKGAKLEGFAYPATVLLDRRGAIRGLWIGFVPGDERAVRVAIESALADQSK